MPRARDGFATDHDAPALSSAAPEVILTNARLVLEDRVVTGSIVFRDGRIAALDPGSTRVPGAEDLGGDLLVPGLVELHTDNLERHLEPRPGVAWPVDAAIVAHDAELAGVGITTVFDALRVGSIHGGPSERKKYARQTADAILALHRRGNLRIRHRLHLRAEICSETLLEELAEFAPDDRVGIVSLMDHTPGARQFRDLSKLRAYVMGKGGLDEAGFVAHVATLQALRARVGAAHEAGAVAEAKRLGAVLASHDDTTAAQVAVSARHGATIAEFPTTEEAAAACRDHGIAVMMGAPNLLRGGSHSGNVATATLVDRDLTDILSSDYAPASLLMAAVALGARLGNIPAGFRAVTRAPARAAGLTDRGALAVGLLADAVRVGLDAGTPRTRGVWVGGVRTA